MGARLAGDVEPGRPRLGAEPHAARARDVHDVQRAAGRSRQLERARDRPALGLDRARVEERPHVAAPGRPRLRGQRGHELRVLGVHGDGEAEPRGAFHRPRQRELVGHREVVDPARAHERLEADHAALGELVETIDVTGHDPTPEREVDRGAPARSSNLRVERRAVDRGRAAVERHVDQARRAARGERERAALEPLPVRPSRVVEVNVRVDRSRQHEQASCLDAAAATGQLGRDLGDHAIGDADLAELGAGDHEVEGHRSASRSWTILTTSARAVARSAPAGFPSRTRKAARIESFVCTRAQMMNGNPKRSR